MIALQLKEHKKFMETLLCSDVFDNFLLEKAVIQSAAEFTIDGHCNREFFFGDEAMLQELANDDCLPFSLLRPHIYSLIRGTHTPTGFQFVLKLSAANLQKTLQSVATAFTPQDVNGMYLNLHFQNGLLSCTAAISYRTFSLDHTLDKEWDALVKKFLARHKILFDEL